MSTSIALGVDRRRIQAGTLHYGTYVALFGNPKKLKRFRADKRTARVNVLLKNHPAVFT